MIIIRIIDNLNQLDKPLLSYNITENGDMSNYEKEISVSCTSEGVFFHSDKKTGIKWAIEMLEYNNAKLKRLYLRNENIVHIDIITEPNFISFKSKSRKSDNLSGMFSLPSGYNDKFFSEMSS